MSEHDPYAVMQGQHTAFAGYRDVLNEIQHPIRGVKGFPRHRTLSEQRDLVAGLIRTVFNLEEQLYRSSAGIADTETPRA